MSASAFAISQPDAPKDPFQSLTLTVANDGSLPNLDISAMNSFAGTECSNLYASSNEYCSGHVRIYYQCLPTVDGGEWQQRSENCEDYSGRCIEEDGSARCVDGYGQTGFGKKLLVWGVVLILVGIGLAIWVNPIFFALVIIGVVLLIKFFLGGV